jgi:hypothetical protein
MYQVPKSFNTSQDLRLFRACTKGNKLPFGEDNLTVMVLDDDPESSVL